MSDVDVHDFFQLAGYCLEVAGSTHHPRMPRRWTLQDDGCTARSAQVVTAKAHFNCLMNEERSAAE